MLHAARGYDAQPYAVQRLVQRYSSEAMRGSYKSGEIGHVQIEKYAQHNLWRYGLNIEKPCWGRRVRHANRGLWAGELEKRVRSLA